jgi:MHS family alpha-ketoglutarate permease-like MFS transporter
VIYVSGTTGVLAGTLLAAILSMMLTEGQMTSFGWRIPFILGGVFGLYALYMRSKMTETAIFVEDAEKEEEEGHGERPSLVRSILAHPKLLVQVIGLTVGATVMYYVWAVSAPAYAITVLDIDPTGALWAGVFANVIFLIVLPIWGMVSDRVGRKPILILGSTALCLLLFPLTSFVQDQAWQLFVAMSIALVFIACFVSIGPAVYAEMFPTSIRAAGLGVPYSIAVALFGGTAPYMQTFFAERGTPAGFNVYAIALSIVGILTVLTLPETKGKDLTADD